MIHTYVKKITEENKLLMNKPLHTDVVYYSELKQWSTANAFRSFSIKYVLDGCINYRNEGSVLPVEAGQYMVTCESAHAKAYFDTKEVVRSLCIDICPQTVAEAFTVLSEKNVDLDNCLAGYFQSPQFCESIHTAQATSMGLRLQELQQRIVLEDDQGITKEWFLDLAERIIYQEYGNFLSLRHINFTRPATRKEILRRVRAAQEYIEENFLRIKEIKQIAAHCNMSEYHFYRCFKQVHKKTPLQCIHEKKMQLAKSLLSDPDYKVSDVAKRCGYPNIFTFSKSFKNFYGLSPSFLKK